MGNTKTYRVLFVYYSYSQQTLQVVEAMGEAFRARGWDVARAAIEFTDARYAERFSRFPLRRPYLDLLGMLPAQLRRATGSIRVPAEAQSGGYDLVCIGSPTWWLTTNMPVRSWLSSEDASRVLQGTKFAAIAVCRRYWRNNLETVKRLATERGSTYLDGIHFTWLGGQIGSLLSLLSYLGSGEARPRYLGVPIPPPNIPADQLAAARAFAGSLADRIGAAGARST
jgi:hypothetical protein